MMRLCAGGFELLLSSSLSSVLLFYFAAHIFATLLCTAILAFLIFSSDVSSFTLEFHKQLVSLSLSASQSNAFIFEY